MTTKEKLIRGARFYGIAAAVIICFFNLCDEMPDSSPVSYTHLTLPTIYSV